MKAKKDNSLDGLVKVINKSRAKMTKFLPAFEASVDNIIQTKSTDKNAIEHLLDSISSFMYMGMGQELYIRLLDYYKTIDAEGATFYWELYEEITE